MQPAVAKARSGIVFGRYLLQKTIGRGGMAEVWRADLIGLNDFERQVVVKRILPHLSQNPEFAAMFTAEAKLCARLNHPNIVQVFEFSAVGEELFLAMEYVNGVNLIEVLNRLPQNVPIPIGMAVQIVRDVCRALAYAHELVGDDGKPMRIIHRDISPSNVMLTFSGSVKLLDFGIAKVLSATDSDLTRTGVVKGKIGYLSPEAATGELELDHRTDIFSAGVVLHEMVTRRRLFKGRDDMNTLWLVRNCDVEPPSTHRPDVPAELDRICKRALARDRNDRFSSAEEMAKALTELLRALAWDDQSTATFFQEHGIVASAEGAAAAPPTATAAPAATVADVATHAVTTISEQSVSDTSIVSVTNVVADTRSDTSIIAAKSESATSITLPPNVLRRRWIAPLFALCAAVLAVSTVMAIRAVIPAPPRPTVTPPPPARQEVTKAEPAPRPAPPPPAPVVTEIRPVAAPTPVAPSPAKSRHAAKKPAAPAAPPPVTRRAPSKPPSSGGPNLLSGDIDNNFGP
jgi:serine/threonine-protein kinase